MDLKPASLARILVLLGLLTPLSQNGHLSSEACEDTTWVIAYLYIGHVVPPFVHEVLLRAISDLVCILEQNDTKNLLLKWVVMSDATREQVLHHLRLWSRLFDDLYRPENVRKVVEVNVHVAKMGRLENDLLAEGPTPAECEEDEEIFNQFTITPPPRGFIRRHEPQIGPLLDLLRPASRTAREQA